MRENVGAKQKTPMTRIPFILSTIAVAVLAGCGSDPKVAPAPAPVVVVMQPPAAQPSTPGPIVVAPAAVEEGVVPGGGVAYLRARARLKDLKGANRDQDAGIQIVLRALEEPLRQIVANSGAEPSVVLNKVVEGKDSFGYNAQTAEYGDLVQQGVIDPTKVVRFALQNAASVASLVLTTAAMVAERAEEDKGGGQGGMAGMGGMGGMGGMDM